MARDLFIGVDAGGTFTRSVLVDAAGTVLARGAAGGANHWTTSPEGARETVRAAIRAVLRRPPGPSIDAVAGVGIGWSGLETTGSSEDAKRFVGDAVHATHLVLDSDVRAAHVGAFLGGWGVLVAAGTGSIALGVDRVGRRVRVGGWGHRYGDEGSAAWIATEAIRAALRTADGRASADALWAALRSRVGVGTDRACGLEEAARRVTEWLYAPERRLSEVASFARTVDELADRGDVPSRRVLEAAGRCLAELAVAAAGRLDDPPPVPLSCTGGVWEHSAIVRAAFAEAIGAAGVPFEIVTAVAPAETGAAFMAISAAGRTLPDVIAPGTVAGQ